MKIKLSDGSYVDTDKMSDREAEINEAAMNLFNVCKKHDTVCFIRIILTDKKYMGLNTVNKKEEKTQESFETLVGSLSMFIKEISSGKARVVWDDENDSK